MVIHKTRTRYDVNEYVERGIQYRGENQYRAFIHERGVKLDKTFTTVEAAREWRAVKRGEIFGEVHVDNSIADRTTLASACAWALGRLGEPPYRKPNDKNLASKWRWWQTSKFAKWPLRKVDSRALKRWARDVLAPEVEDDEVDRKEAEKEFGEKIPSPATVIHRLNALSRLIQDWRDHHHLDEEGLPNPVTEGVRPPLKFTKRRRPTAGELEQLLEAPNDSRPWLKQAIILAVETCARQTELARLTWNNVFLEVEHPHILLLDTKNGLDRTVPLSDAAINALLELRDMAAEANANPKSERSAKWGKPLPVETGRGIIHAWSDLLEQINGTLGATAIENLTWHCLRHEGISRLFELTNMSDTQIQAITGHLGREQLERYTHLRAQKLRDMLPTSNGIVAKEGAGSVRLRHGVEAQIKNDKGRWVAMKDADAISKIIARELLKDAIVLLDTP